MSRSIPSAMRVALSRKVSMKSSNQSFLVLATCNAFSFSSRASLQCTRTSDSATSAPQRAADFFHACTRFETSSSRVINPSISCRDSSLGHNSLSIRPTTSLSRPMKGPTLPRRMCAQSMSRLASSSSGTFGITDRSTKAFGSNWQFAKLM